MLPETIDLGGTIVAEVPIDRGGGGVTLGGDIDLASR